MPISSSPIRQGPLCLEISAGGQALPDILQVQSAQLFMSLDQAPLADIVLVEGGNDFGEFPVSEADVFNPGTVIGIAAGYDATPAVLFSGVVVGRKLVIAPGGATLTVSCRAQAKAQAATGPALAVSYGVDILAFEASSTEAKFSGSLSLDGTAAARPGGSLVVDGVGKRFSGQAVIRAVSHEIGEGNWLTRVDFERLPSVTGQ